TALDLGCKRLSPHFFRAGNTISKDPEASEISYRRFSRLFASRARLLLHDNLVRSELEPLLVRLRERFELLFPFERGPVTTNDVAHHILSILKLVHQNHGSIGAVTSCCPRFVHVTHALEDPLAIKHRDHPQLVDREHPTANHDGMLLVQALPARIGQ